MLLIGYINNDTILSYDNMICICICINIIYMINIILKEFITFFQKLNIYNTSDKQF